MIDFRKLTPTQRAGLKALRAADRAVIERHEEASSKGLHYWAAQLRSQHAGVFERAERDLPRVEALLAANPEAGVEVLRGALEHWPMAPTAPIASDDDRAALAQLESFQARGLTLVAAQHQGRRAQAIQRAVAERSVTTLGEASTAPTFIERLSRSGPRVAAQLSNHTVESLTRTVKSNDASAAAVAQLKAREE